MELLERADCLEELHHGLREAACGRGAMVFLSGPSGMGKSALVQQFSAWAASHARILVGTSDPLSTPRPLEPLLDIASQVGGELERTLVAGRNESFRCFLSLLQGAGKPNVVVFEDLHWADEATLDLIRFLARRIEPVRVLIIATYRDDEVGPRHPLRVLLGDLATSRTVRRMPLAPLSEDAVRLMAEGSDVDAAMLHRRTGGNPFFVTEVLAAPGSEIPETVRDAIVSRLSRASKRTRAALEAAAVIGARAETWLLERVVDGAAEAVDEALSVGMIGIQGQNLVFHHELVREAVLQTLSPPRHVVLHKRVLEALCSRPTKDLARLSHHAEAAGDAEAVLEYAPAAAKSAGVLKAHREAASQYERALRFADSLDPGNRAELLQDFAFECALVGRSRDAIEADREAAILWRQLGEAELEGSALKNLAADLMQLGLADEAQQTSKHALELLERLPPGRFLASAYAVEASLRLRYGDARGAIEFGEKATVLGERLGEQRVLVAGYHWIGSAMLQLGDENGWANLERSLDLANLIGSEDCATLALSTLSAVAVTSFRWDRAERYLEEGLARAAENDFDAERLSMLAYSALFQLNRGRWREAAKEALEVTANAHAPALARAACLTVLARVRTRRGDPDAAAALAEAISLAKSLENLQLLADAYSVELESAFWSGRDAPELDSARRVHEKTLAKWLPWQAGTLGFWLWKAGALAQPTPSSARPFELQALGEWRQAANEWKRLGCPFEEAFALTECRDEGSLRRALELFTSLGAPQGQALASRRLRELGVKGIPRGARATTTRNPGRLTARELEVMELLSGGLRNSEIAVRLHLSPKTVGHHVSAILSKLEVGSRTEAVHAANALGLLADFDSRQSRYRVDVRNGTP